MSSHKAKDNRKVPDEFQGISEICPFLDYLNITFFFFFLFQYLEYVRKENVYIQNARMHVQQYYLNKETSNYDSMIQTKKPF